MVMMTSQENVNSRLADDEDDCWCIQNGSGSGARRAVLFCLQH